jgi:hypothetical protein
MIRSFLIASVVLVHSAICYAQSMLPVQQDTTLFLHSNEVVFSGVADYQSTSVGKDITKSFFYGGFIDDEMKGASSGRQQLVNRFGIDINTEIEYRNHKRALFKDSTIGYLFKYGFYNFSGIQYTEDVFDLLFFGNSSFIGDTAFLSGSQFSSYTFQKIGFGWFDKYSKSSLTVNAIGVHNSLSGVINKGELYQSASIDSVDFSLDAVYKSSNSQTFCGFGIALDLDYRFNMPKSDSEFIYFQLMAKNLGLVFMPDVIQNRIQGELAYDNYSINDLLNSQTIFQNTDETFGSFSDTVETKGNWRVLPAMLQFTKLVNRNSSQKIQGFYGARAYLSSSFMPMFFVGLDVHPIKRYRFGLQASYGGFSNLRWGMYSDLKFDKFSFGIASENLFSQTGESIIIRMSCAF